MLHVAQISFFLDPQGRAAGAVAAMTGRRWSMSQKRLMERACASRSFRPVMRAEKFRRNGVDYYFVAARARGRRRSRAHGPFGDCFAELKPDVCHVHGLGFLRRCAALSALAPQTSRFSCRITRAGRREYGGDGGGARLCPSFLRWPSARASRRSPSKTLVSVHPQTVDPRNPGVLHALHAGRASRGAPADRTGRRSPVFCGSGT